MKRSDCRSGRRRNKNRLNRLYNRFPNRLLRHQSLKQPQTVRPFPNQALTHRPLLIQLRLRKLRSRRPRHQPKTNNTAIDFSDEAKIETEQKNLHTTKI